MKFKAKKKLNESVVPCDDIEAIKKAREQEYRKLAGLKECDVITEDILDDWALNTASCNQRCSVDDIRSAVLESVQLNEETIGQAAAAVQAQEAVAENQPKGQIEAALDRALKVAKRGSARGKHGDYPNILFIGEAGTGKSAVIRQWAKDNDINLFEVRAAGMDATDLGGAIAPDKETGSVKRFSSTEFDKLDRPNSVLFLDEYNRAPREVRTNLLELVNSHVIPDARSESGQRFLPNFLFTIAAINPPTADYDTDVMDAAETSRFRSVNVTFDPLYNLRYLQKYYDKLIAETEDKEEKIEAMRKKALATKLLSDPSFTFDNQSDMQRGKEQLGSNYLVLNYRSLFNLLEYSDGTKKDFLELWSDYVNPLKKKMAETILASYKDVDDKANQALQKETKSTVFKKKENIVDILRRQYDL